MPTANPRVNVTLSPSLYSLVGELASLERVSKSNVLREFLEAAEPQLRQVVALMNAAKGASGKARKEMVQGLESSLQTLQGVQHLAMQAATGHTRDMVSEAEAVKGRRPRRGAIAPLRVAAPRPRAAALGKLPSVPKRPPLSNRGVKS